MRLQLVLKCFVWTRRNSSRRLDHALLVFGKVSKNTRTGTWVLIATSQGPKKVVSVLVDDREKVTEACFRF